MDRILKPQILKKNPVFDAFIEFDNDLSDDVIDSVFELINRSFPNFKLISSDLVDITYQLEWKEFKSLATTLLPKSKNDSVVVKLLVPVYMQYYGSNLCETQFVEGLSISYGLEETTQRNSFSFAFYANVYTDYRKDILIENLGGSKSKEVVQVYQAEAAARNRTRLTKIIYDIQTMLKGDITEYLSSYIDDQYLFPYGIKSNAVLR